MWISDYGDFRHMLIMFIVASSDNTISKSFKSSGEVMKSALGSFCFIQFKRDLLKGCQLQYVFTLSNCFENNWKTYSRTHIDERMIQRIVAKSRPCMPVVNMVMAPCVTSYRINFERSSIFEFLVPKPKGTLSGYYHAQHHCGPVTTFTKSNISHTSASRVWYEAVAVGDRGTTRGHVTSDLAFKPGGSRQQSKKANEI